MKREREADRGREREREREAKRKTDKERCGERQGGWMMERWSGLRGWRSGGVCFHSNLFTLQFVFSERVHSFCLTWHFTHQQEERERESVCVCVCVCVWASKRERWRKKRISFKPPFYWDVCACIYIHMCVCMCVCVCVCVCVWKLIYVLSYCNRVCLFIYLCVCVCVCVCGADISFASCLIVIAWACVCANTCMCLLKCVCAMWASISGAGSDCNYSAVKPLAEATNNRPPFVLNFLCLCLCPKSFTPSLQREFCVEDSVSQTAKLKKTCICSIYLW